MSMAFSGAVKELGPRKRRPGDLQEPDLILGGNFRPYSLWVVTPLSKSSTAIAVYIHSVSAGSLPILCHYAYNVRSVQVRPPPAGIQGGDRSQELPGIVHRDVIKFASSPQLE